MGSEHKVEVGCPYTQGGTLINTNTVGADPGVDGAWTQGRGRLSLHSGWHTGWYLHCGELTPGWMWPEHKVEVGCPYTRVAHWLILTLWGADPGVDGARTQSRGRLALHSGWHIGWNLHCGELTTGWMGPKHKVEVDCPTTQGGTLNYRYTVGSWPRSGFGLNTR